MRVEWPADPEGLDAQARAWVESIANAYGGALLGLALAVVVLLLLLAFVFVPSVRRRIWCAHSRREVVVAFEETGLPGWRRRTAVLSCSAFDPPTDVRCQCPCLDCSPHELAPPSGFERNEQTARS
jgi:hypothetical protein